MAGTGSRHIHLVTAGYLRRFGTSSKVMRHDVATGDEESKGVRGVGWEFDYWGPDQALADQVEESLEECERVAIDLLRRLDSLWPLTSPERPQLAQFIAIHLVRSPAFRVFLRQTTEAAIADERGRGRVDPEFFGGVAQVFRGDRMHANSLLGQITRVASLLSCMQWTLVRFDDDQLIVGDQPLSILPVARRAAINPASAMPSTGLVHTMEIRFPLDPKTLLLMSWAQAEDAAQPVSGTLAQANNSNCSQRGQAINEWYFRPGTRPLFLDPQRLEPVVAPIATQIHPGYNVSAWQRSSRRLAADKMMAKMIEQQEPRDVVRWVHPTPLGANVVR